MISRRGFIRSLWITGWSSVVLLLQRIRAPAAVPRIEIPLSQLTKPWSFAEFEFTKQIKTNRGFKESTFPGYAIRLPDETAKQLQLKQVFYVLSRICPHEGCPIRFHKERSEVPQPLPVEKFDHPMLVCSCHQSMFDPTDKGKVIGARASSAMGL